MTTHTTNILLIAALLLASCTSSAPPYTLLHDPQPYEYDQPSPFYLYLPDGYDPARAWPAFVGIHGFGSDGLSCLDMWQGSADQAGYVLICPSLADENGGWYVEQGETKLLSVLKAAQSEANLQPKIFLAGFSAGAEFAQAFTFDHPDRVAAVAVLSSGNYIDPAAAARGIPFLVVIGERDKAAALSGAQQFNQSLQQDGFSVEFHTLPGVAHTFTDHHRDLTLDFFKKVNSER